MELTRANVEQAARNVAALALIEDVGTGDLTSEALFAQDDLCQGRILLKQPGVVAGLPAVQVVFEQLDRAITLELLAEDGDAVSDAPHELARLEGRARPLFAGERVALNLLGRLSGIATLTHRFVQAVEGTAVQILDTRKTTPGLRALEKYAVRVGGGVNHRFGLDDAILVKDNHLQLSGGIAEAVRRLRSASSLALEIEADTLDQVADALELGVERILLDNMSPAEVARAVELVGRRSQLEVSGGVTLENVRAYAETGVDAISIGALTHSAASLDVSLEVEPL